MKNFMKKSTVAVVGVIVGYLLASSQGEASVTTANVKEAVVVTSEAELAEVTNAVSFTTAEKVEEQEQPVLIPAKANTTRDKSISVPDETKTVTTASNKAVKAVVTKKPEQPVEIASIETTEPVEVVNVPPVETQITEPPVDETPAPAPPPVPAAPIAIDDSQQAQVLEDYNAVADAAIADVLNSLDL